MWDLPRPGIEPVSPALTGGFLTTTPPGKPRQSISRDVLPIVQIFITEFYFFPELSFHPMCCAVYCGLFPTEYTSRYCPTLCFLISYLLFLAFSAKHTFIILQLSTAIGLFLSLCVSIFCTKSYFYSLVLLF